MRSSERKRRSASRVFPRRSRLVSSTACSAFALLLAGCGGDEQALQPKEPVLPQAVANDLATQADAVADALANEDVEAARAGAVELRADVISAIQAGRVPGPLQEELTSAVNRLVVSIPPQPDPKDEPGNEDKGKGEGKDKGKGDEGHGD